MKLFISTKDRVMNIIDAHIKHFQQLQTNLSIGSIEWKYYQGKINAITDLKKDIKDLL